MAIRPIFLPCFKDRQLVEVVNIDFHWYPGMATSQKQKSIISLHESAKKKGIEPVLEISSKAANPLGKQLSAFNLCLTTQEYGNISVEAIFQGSKVFEFGGPFLDLLKKNGWDIKKDARIKNSGQLKSFSFQGTVWELEPKTAFYDWIYLNALHANNELGEQIIGYNGFSDIEFNPQKSINCQARTCALYVSLYKRGLINDVLSNRALFIDMLKMDSRFQKYKIEKSKQKSLFE